LITVFEFSILNVIYGVGRRLVKITMDLEIRKLETDMGKPCIIVDGYTFRQDAQLKCEQISWRRTANRKNCKARPRTDLDTTEKCCLAILSIIMK